MAAVIMAPAVAGADLRQEPDLRIQIRVYDHARVPDGTLERAQQEVSSILQKAGVHMTWRRCSTDAECPERRAPTELYVRIFPSEMADRLTKDPAVYAWSSPGDDPVSGYLADAFYHRIEGLSAKTGAPCSLLLGLFLAHEIGHLLLGSNSHSGSGIMHIPYDKSQMRQAFAGTLLFTGSEARRIRSGVEKRRAVGLLAKE